MTTDQCRNQGLKGENVKVEHLREDIKNLKAEMNVLKNSVKALAGIKQEGKMLRKSVETICLIL